LSIVKHVVQRHGGELDVQSELGKGSTFRLLFPAARVRAMSAVGHANVTSTASSGTADEANAAASASAAVREERALP
jgi:two-component system phosphate regulon sensor histidine kinase PhoR